MNLTRTITRQMAFISMIASAASFVGCATTPVTDSSTEPSREVGKLGLNLTLPDGSIINTVGYSITGNGITPLTGVIPVQQAGATISSAISGVPAGSNYTVTLTANTTDGKSSCLGVATFSITAGQTTQVSVGLQCRAGKNNGTLLINGQINECPSVTAFAVQPLTQQVPGTITVSSAASDPESSALTYTWADSAHDGSFASASSASTTFTCNLSGTTTLSVSVDDGHGCTDSAMIQVTCTSAAVCGNNTVEPGEQCDDGNTVNTDGCVGTTCRTAVCGDGFVRAGVEACDDGNTVAGDGCENNCTVTPPPAGCGNGVVDTGEECDTGAGVKMSTATCAYPACTNIICGNNRVDGSEVCDGTVGPTGGLGLGQVCNSSCTAITDNCMACEVANCTDYLGLGSIDLVAGCYHDPNPTNVQLCVDAINCARTNNCAYTSRGAEQCYCGTASSANCSQGIGVNGVCQAKFEAAAGSTNATFVTNNFGNRSLPIGNAVLMLACDTASCNAHVGGQPTQCVP